MAIQGYSLVLETPVERDAAWDAEVRRELVSVLAAREEHSLGANVVGWLICVIIGGVIGFSELIVGALGLRLLAICVTRWSCQRLRRRLSEGGDFEPAFRLSQWALTSAGVSWAMLTWPLIEGPSPDPAEIALLGVATVGVCLICSLVGLSLPVLFGFASTFTATVIAGSLVIDGAIDLAICGAILLPLLATLSFGIGSHRQACQAAQDAVDKLHLREQLASSLHHAEFLSLHDPLTGLFNRRALFENETSPTGPRGLIVIDLDHFKAINDRYGHQLGDQVLVTVSGMLRAFCRAPGREDWLAGRLGGEEFLVITGPLSHDALLDAAESVRQAVINAFPIAAAPDLRVTTSIGVELWTPAMTLDEAISRADAALYGAKQAGRNRVISARDLARAA